MKDKGHWDSLCCQVTKRPEGSVQKEKRPNLKREKQTSEREVRVFPFKLVLLVSVFVRMWRNLKKKSARYTSFRLPFSL